MSNDNPRQEAATSRDSSRPAATNDDSDYSLSIEEVVALYEAAGIPRTMRSVQPYCAKGDLDAHRIGLQRMLRPLLGLPEVPEPARKIEESAR